MESFPLLKSVLGDSVILFGLPEKQVWGVLDANTLAESLDNVGRVIEQVVSVNDTDVNGAVLCSMTIGSICVHSTLSAYLGPNLTNLAQIVKDSALFVIAGLGGHEVVEAGDLVQRWDGAAEVAGNAVLGMPDQECKVELLQDILGDDGRVAGLCLGVVWVWSAILARAIRSIAIGSTSIGGRSIAVGADTTLECVQRRSDRGRLPGWRHQVVGDVLDEDALVLMEG